MHKQNFKQKNKDFRRMLTREQILIGKIQAANSTVVPKKRNH